MITLLTFGEKEGKGWMLLRAMAKRCEEYSKDSLDDEAKVRYEKKLLLIDLATCPYNYLRKPRWTHFLEKLAKSVALLSTVPKFCGEFVSAPTTEPNIPKCLGDLYSESNRNLIQEDLRVLCKRVADELVVTKSEALNLPLENNQQMP